MHPQKEHRTSTTPYDEARWLGFFNMGAQTAPAAKIASFTATDTSPTPSKMAPPPRTMSKLAPPRITPHINPVLARPTASKTTPAPGFEFTFRRAPSVELSEDAQKIMAESREEAAKIRAQLVAMPSVPETEPEEMEKMTGGRKIAQPKGKVGRFSDVHMQTFKKMDSIADHPSAWRLNAAAPAPAVQKPTTQALKRSPSKAELDESSVPASLKRSPSKPVLKTEPSPFLTRSPSKLGLLSSGGRVEPDRPVPSAKRVKRVGEDDAGTTRPQEVETPPKPAQGLVRSKSGLLRPGFTSATSPTKSSMARTAAANGTKATTQIPALGSNTSNNLRQQYSSSSALPRSKSMRDLKPNPSPNKTTTQIPISSAPSPSPTKIAFLPQVTPVKAPARLSTSSPMSTDTPKHIKSILRTPNRRYTQDPMKIAAGTHMATPPRKTTFFPNVPATAPVIKRVDFTNSTKDRAERDAFKAASAEPEVIAYPELQSTTPDRRATMAAVPSIPGSFTFRAGQEIKFASPKVPTIRQVHTSDASGLPPAFQFTGARALGSPTKRKLDTLDESGETSEKENRDEDADGERPAKKARVSSGGAKSAPATPMKKAPPSMSKLPRFGAESAKRGGMTAARLSMLAKPKRRV